MPQFGPVKRDELIRSLMTLGFEGPYSGARHQLMLKGQLRLALPTPHHGDIGRELLSRILKQAGISRDEWERL